MSPAATHDDLGRIRHIPLRYDSRNDSHASALSIIRSLMPDWASGKDDNVEFIRFTDGITNTLLKAVNRSPGLSQADVDRDAILLRAYGSGTAVLIDREREAANHELLMRYGLAPELLARFENGMLYRFVPGTPCQPHDLRRPSVLASVARRLAEWHARVPCLRMTSAPLANGLSNDLANGPTNGQSRAVQAESEARIVSASGGKPIPNLWTTMQKWILALPTETKQQRERQSRLQLELGDIIGKLSQRPGLGLDGLVFAHCDLLSANVIMHRAQDGGRDRGQDRSQGSGDLGSDDVTSVSFIDYEYGTPSPAAFDLANHFAEWAGYDCDYSAVPTVSQRRAFIREYIREYIKLSDGQDGSLESEDAEERKLMEEVDAYRGVPGFYWGIWSSIQATISEIDFDYANYSESRLSEYWSYKEERDGTRAAEGREMSLREKTWFREE
ncbi:ethanolamine kinase [Geosmithia morbida]|uniref:ethanolamine kinase n=1 Tax=Geosmithia morbida TaxID=1094350 RepID=A0A9P4YTP6_9HYPO|nr:ethanolamine kinase [Geosmithia morbida]KAF4122625.1 ethanolamine kinase [Geosmithia morbida]